MKMEKRGFTLTELLVTIGVMVVLAGMIFPVFSKVRERAKQVTCVNNLKQLSYAIQMYCDDNDGRLPYVAALGPYQMYTRPDLALYDPPYHYLRDCIDDPYVKNERIWYCPAISLDDNIRPGQITFRENRTSYNFNYRTPPDAPQLAGHEQKRISGTMPESFLNPANVASLWDLPHWPPPVTNPPHNKGVNVAYFDGHVKWVNLSGQKGEVQKYNFWRDLSWQGLYEY